MRWDPWEEYEDKFIKESLGELTTLEVGQVLGRTKIAVERRAFRLGVIENPVTYEISLEDENFIKHSFEKDPKGIERIAKQLGKTDDQVKSVLKKLGLKVPPHNDPGIKSRISAQKCSGEN